jgi:hypothetical protein
MGGKKSSPAPVATTTPQTNTPNVDVATEAAKRALDARSGAVGAVNAETTEDDRRPKFASDKPDMMQPKPRKRERDAAGMVPAGGGIQQPAVITG